ncbi:MAG: hypothetical protein M3340_00425 [Actinomycetota bacterium]|nr:hypothetical protein [Actinomycetota bacterium]
MGSSFTRRDLVQRGATLAGAAGAASIFGLSGLEKALAAGGLSAERQATYTALVEAVAAAGGSKVSASNVERTTADFAASYAGTTTEGQRHIDRVLDAVERKIGVPSFSELPKRAGLEQLRAWLGADPQAKSPAGPARPAIAIAALDLVELMFPRDPADGAIHATL